MDGASFKLRVSQWLLNWLLQAFLMSTKPWRSPDAKSKLATKLKVSFHYMIWKKTTTPSSTGSFFLLVMVHMDSWFMQSSETLAFRVVLCHELVILISLDRLAANPHHDIPCQVKFTGRRGCWRCPHTFLGFLSTQAVFGILLKMIDVETQDSTSLKPWTQPDAGARPWPDARFIDSFQWSFGRIKGEADTTYLWEEGAFTAVKNESQVPGDRNMMNVDAKESNGYSSEWFF